MLGDRQVRPVGSHGCACWQRVTASQIIQTFLNGGKVALRADGRRGSRAAMCQCALAAHASNRRLQRPVQSASDEGSPSGHPTRHVCLRRMQSVLVSDDVARGAASSSAAGLPEASGAVAGARTGSTNLVSLNRPCQALPARNAMWNVSSNVRSSQYPRRFITVPLPSSVLIRQ